MNVVIRTNFKRVSQQADIDRCLDNRRIVFVEELGMDPALVYDDHDKTCHHFRGNIGPAVNATARLVPKGPIASIECVAVLRGYRRRGLASGIVKCMVKFAQRKGFTAVELMTTHDVMQLYRNLGFTTTGAPHKEFGLIYQKMRLKL